MSITHPDQEFANFIVLKGYFRHEEGFHPSIHNQRYPKTMDLGLYSDPQRKAFSLGTYSLGLVRSDLRPRKGERERFGYITTAKIKPRFSALKLFQIQLMAH